jgi:hypothetical protein
MVRRGNYLFFWGSIEYWHDSVSVSPPPCTCTVGNCRGRGRGIPSTVLVSLLLRRRRSNSIMHKVASTSWIPCCVPHIHSDDSHYYFDWYSFVLVLVPHSLTHSLTRSLTFQSLMVASIPRRRACPPRWFE